MSHYAEFVQSRRKSPEDIELFGVVERDILHAILGISSEAGEITDAVKKHLIYDQPLDRENLVEELGDLHFYAQQLCNAIGVSHEEVVRLNIAKLSVRYPRGYYRDEDAKRRADKTES